MKYIKVFFFLFLLLSSSIWANEKEDLLRGVTLERISQFLTYKEGEEVFTICVYNNKATAKSFTKLYKTRKYKELPIHIVYVNALKDIKQCDILYAKDPSKKELQGIVGLKQKYTLLVSDKVANLEDGFMLALYPKDNKMNFAINQQALVDANLKVNYRLLRVASIVVNPVKQND